MPTDQRHGVRGTRRRRILTWALIAAVPGAILTVVNLTLVTGEAQLTVGIGAGLLLIGGLITGAALGAREDLDAPGAALGAVLGALPGIAAFFLPGTTRLAPFILIAGAIAGGIIRGRAAPTR